MTQGTPGGNPKNLTPFKPGQSGNPGGKPVNARNQLTKQFLNLLAKDFEAHGKTAIENMRIEDPSGYIKAIAGLLPKEFIIERPLDGMSDDELTSAISDLRARLAAVEDPGIRTGNQALPKPIIDVPTVQ